MTKIALISDTHSYFEEDVNKYLRECDYILHAGDIGDVTIYDKYSKLGKLKAVHGNIDNHEVRIECPEYLFFKIEDISILMIHIGGYPGRYTPKASALIRKYKPDLFISGHSHILKIIPDRKNDLLHMNPGACGKKGFHAVRTLILFDIEDDKMKNARVVELSRR